MSCGSLAPFDHTVDVFLVADAFSSIAIASWRGRRIKPLWKRRRRGHRSIVERAPKVKRSSISSARREREYLMVRDRVWWKGFSRLHIPVWETDCSHEASIV